MSAVQAQGESGGVQYQACDVLPLKLSELLSGESSQTSVAHDPRMTFRGVSLQTFREG